MSTLSHSSNLHTRTHKRVLADDCARREGFLSRSPENPPKNFPSTHRARENFSAARSLFRQSKEAEWNGEFTGASRNSIKSVGNELITRAWLTRAAVAVSESPPAHSGQLSAMYNTYGCTAAAVATFLFACWFTPRWRAHQEWSERDAAQSPARYSPRVSAKLARALLRGLWWTCGRSLALPHLTLTMGFRGKFAAVLYICVATSALICAKFAQRAIWEFDSSVEDDWLCYTRELGVFSLYLCESGFYDRERLYINTFGKWKGECI